MNRLFAFLIGFFLSIVCFAQGFVSIKGSVVDSDGKPVVGASVVAVGTKLAFTTNASGSFEARIPNTVNYLQVRKVGYASQNIKVGATTVRVVLKVDEAAQKAAAEKAAAQKAAAEKAAAEKAAAQKAAAQKAAAEKTAAQKAAAEKAAAQKAAAEKAAAQKATTEKTAAEKSAAEKAAAEKAAAQKAAAEKAAAEKAAAEKAEAERVAAEKAIAEKIAAEVEAARLEAEKSAAEQIERMRQEKEAMEQVARMNAEKAAAEKAKAERLAAEKAAAEKAEAERVAAEKAEAERLAAEKAEAERLAAETAARDRKARRGLQHTLSVSYLAGANTEVYYYNVGLRTPAAHPIQVDYTLGYRFNSSIAVGLCAGFMKFLHNYVIENESPEVYSNGYLINIESLLAIPISVNAKCCFGNGSIHPLIQGSFGMDILSSSAVIDAGVGIELRKGYRSGLQLMAGYATIPTFGSGAFKLKAGYMF